MRIIIEIEEGRVTSTTVDGVAVGPGGMAAADASLTPPPDLLRRAAALGAVSAGPATLRPEGGAGGPAGAGEAVVAGQPGPAAGRRTAAAAARSARAGGAPMAAGAASAGDAGAAPIGNAGASKEAAGRRGTAATRGGRKRGKRR